LDARARVSGTFSRLLHRCGKIDHTPACPEKTMSNKEGSIMNIEKREINYTIFGKFL
jgi:hypothetical protein